MKTATLAITTGPNGDDFYCAVGGLTTDADGNPYSWITVSAVNPSTDYYNEILSWDIDIPTGIQGITLN